VQTEISMMSKDALRSKVSPAAQAPKPYAFYLLFLLALVNLLNVFDKLILSMALEPIKQEFSLSDGQMGLIAGLSLALFNAIAMVPIGMLADRTNRRNLISVCLAIWSLATACGGMASTWIQLLLTRIVVGIGEAGGGPPSLSMISDTFPQEKRATVLSIFSLTTAMGGMLALALGGWMVSHYGWRMTLIAAGAPGLVLSLLLFLTVKEPARAGRHAADACPADRPGLKRVFGYFWTCRSLRHIGLGIMLIAFVISAIAAWTPAYLMRTFDVPLGQVGFMLGGASLVALVGAPLGGVLADRLARRDRRWWCWIVAITVGSGGLFLLGFTSASTTAAAIGFFAAYTFVIAVWYGPSYGMVQTLVVPQMRATMTAICYMGGNVIGFGLGTQSIGLLSDALRPVAGAESLRYAMMILIAVAGWAVFHFIMAARTLREDLATVDERQ